MAFTFGFYNSFNGDRKYNAEQVSAIFDGLIHDGVYDSIGDIFATTPGEGLQVIVGSGKAWFHHTWNVNDAPVPLSLENPDILLPRIDAVVLEIDNTKSVRANALKIVTGVPASTPSKPTMLRSSDLEGVNQYALAYVTVGANASAITAADIEINVGKSDCPFVTSIVQSTDIDALFNQWEGEFDAWFDNLKEQLGDNVVTNLQKQIDEKLDKVADKATSEMAQAGVNDTHYMTPKLVAEMLTVSDVGYADRYGSYPTNIPVPPNRSIKIGNSAYSYALGGDSSVKTLRKYKISSNDDVSSFVIFKGEITVVDSNLWTVGSDDVPSITVSFSPYTNTLKRVIYGSQDYTVSGSYKRYILCVNDNTILYKVIDSSWTNYASSPQGLYDPETDLYLILRRTASSSYAFDIRNSNATLLKTITISSTATISLCGVHNSYAYFSHGLIINLNDYSQSLIDLSSAVFSSLPSNKYIICGDYICFISHSSNKAMVLQGTLIIKEYTFTSISTASSTLTYNNQNELIYSSVDTIYHYVLNLDGTLTRTHIRIADIQPTSSIFAINALIHNKHIYFMTRRSDTAPRFRYLFRQAIDNKKIEQINTPYFMNEVEVSSTSDATEWTFVSTEENIYLLDTFGALDISKIKYNLIKTS